MLDRLSLRSFAADKRHVLVTDSYALPGLPPFPLGEIADSQLPWYIAHFRAGKPVFLRRIPEELPPEAKKERLYCTLHGIKSGIAVPLRAGGSTLGALTFSFLHRYCEWPAEVVPRLQIIGDVFASALQCKQADETLRSSAFLGP